MSRKGGVDEEKVFHKIPGIDDTRIEEIFARETLRLLVGRKLLSPKWAEKILAWPHLDFNVHSLVRAKTKPEAERIGKHMLRPILALERLTLLEGEGEVEAMEFLIDKLGKTKTNQDFLNAMSKGL